MDIGELMRRRHSGGKKSILPSGYEQLEYIQGNNKTKIIAYINSGDVLIVTAQGVPPIGSTQILLCVSSMDSRWMGSVSTNNGQWSIGGSNGTFTDVNYSDVTQMEVIFTNTQVSLTINGETKTRNGSSTVSNTLLHLFGFNDNYLSNSKLYALEQYRDGVMLKSLVPCQEITTSKIGFYDIINNNFIEY